MYASCDRGSTTLKSAVAVVCWGQTYGLGSLGLGLRDAHKYARIRPYNRVLRRCNRPLSLGQQTTVIPTLSVGGAYHESPACGVSDPSASRSHSQAHKLLTRSGSAQSSFR